MIIHKLTTVDNPYDPYYEFGKWWEFDNSPERNYGTAQYLARVAYKSIDVSNDMYNQMIDDAIDEIIEKNYLPNDVAAEALKHYNTDKFYKKIEYQV